MIIDPTSPIELLSIRYGVCAGMVDLQCYRYGRLAASFGIRSDESRLMFRGATLTDEVGPVAMAMMLGTSSY